MRSTRLLPAALLTLTVCAAPFGAYGAGIARILHPRGQSSEPKDSRITVTVSNKSGLVQHIQVGDRHYTMMPNGGLSITAPEGTDVVAVDSGFKHRAGETLCSMSAKTNLQTVVIH